MKKTYVLKIICVFFIFVSHSCKYNAEKEQQWTREEAIKRLDSINLTKLIASYNEGDGYTLLITNDSLYKTARKLTYQPGFPVLVDSLVHIKNKEFRSKQFATTYIINDSEVVIINNQKIIHPSSNWQGQTPWKEVIVSNYERTDQKLNKEN